MQRLPLDSMKVPGLEVEVIWRTLRSITPSAWNPSKQTKTLAVKTTMVVVD